MPPVATPVTAALMGLVGSYFAMGAIFITAAGLCIPTLIVLSFIRPDEIDYARARNAASNKRIPHTCVIKLAKNRRLVLFTAALALFQLANASILPLIGEGLATAVSTEPSLWISGFIIIPQIVVAVLAPWVGYHSEKRGRKPLLLIGFTLPPIRAALLAFTNAYAFLIVAQPFDGVTGAIVGVLTTLVITDLTAGTGRFNLAQGIVGAVTGIAASVSTLATGFLFQGVGSAGGFSRHCRDRGCGNNFNLDVCFGDETNRLFGLTAQNECHSSQSAVRRPAKRIKLNFSVFRTSVAEAVTQRFMP